MRSLKKTINKITEKVAYKIVAQDSGAQKVEVSKTNLKDFIGNPLFSSRNFYGSQVPPGVVIGLAYNQVGGSILYIESVWASKSEDGKSRGGVKVTG